MRRLRAIGIMSGTSLDGMDGVLIELLPRGNAYKTRILGHRFHGFPAELRELARDVAKRNLLREATKLGIDWSETAALLVKKLRGNLPVDVIGAHGQTLVHDPSHGFTIQVADLSRLAQRTGITVVGNFRPADIAAGGEGAPLAPAGHRLLFGSEPGPIAVQNLGGIGNVTLLRNGRVDLAFDTGPANLWLDTVMRWKTGGKLLFDRDGSVAAAGTVNRVLLARLLAHPYFRRKPPKSAGWEEFGPSYLSRHRKLLNRLRLEDALATVTFGMAIATAEAYERFVLPRAKPKVIVLAGGGARNKFLVRILKQLLLGIPISGTEAFGIPPEQLEPVCFALLAVETLRGRPGNEPRATGAKRRVTCGEIVWGAAPQIDSLRTVLLR